MEINTIVKMKKQISCLESTLKLKLEEWQIIKEKLVKVEQENKKLYEENYELKKRREMAVREISELSSRIKTHRNFSLRKEQSCFNGYTETSMNSSNIFSNKDIQKLCKARSEIEAIYKEVINLLFSESKESDKESNDSKKLQPKNMEWVINLERKINSVIKCIKEIQGNYDANLQLKSINESLSCLNNFHIDI